MPDDLPAFFVVEPLSFRLTTRPEMGADAGIPSSVTPLGTHDIWLRLDAFTSNFGIATVSLGGAKEIGTYSVRGSTLELTFDAESSLPASSTAGCVTSRIDYASMAFRVTDFREDGSVLHLEGSARGTVTHVVGDTATSVPFEGSTSGDRDDAAPALVISSASDVHPLSPLRVVVDEPIGAASLDLVDATTSAVLEPGAFVAVPNDALAVEFVRSNTGALPYGASLRVQPATGEALDADGNAATPVSFTVVSAPTAITGTTFEGSNVEYFGSAARIDDMPYPTWPAIEGTGALAFSPGSVATFRLTSTTETELVVRVRYGSSSGFELESPIHLRFFDATSRALVVLPPPDALTWTTGGGAGLEATQVVTLTTPLPAFARGTTFSIAISGPEETFCGSLPAPPAHLLVEEIGLE